MSSVQVKVKVSGDRRRLMKRLAMMADVDVKGINRTIAEGIRTSTMQRFRVEKDPEGRKWEPSIRARQTGGKTLTQTGRMKTSIRSTASAEGWAVGTNDIKAATHQFGDERTIRPRRGPVLRFQVDGKWVSAHQVHVRIPARPFLGISEEDDKMIQKELEAAVEEH